MIELREENNKIYQTDKKIKKNLIEAVRKEKRNKKKKRTILSVINIKRGLNNRINYKPYRINRENNRYKKL